MRPRLFTLPICVMACCVMACGGPQDVGPNDALPPEFDGDDGSEQAPPDPLQDLHDGGGTSTGNPILEEGIADSPDILPAASPGEPDGPSSTPPLGDPFDYGNFFESGTVPTSSDDCADIDPKNQSAQKYLIGARGGGDLVIDLEQHLMELLWPLGAPSYSAILRPAIVATHPLGGVAFFLSKRIPFQGMGCQLFLLENSLQTLHCVDPTAIGFGQLPHGWGLPPSLHRTALQFDASGNFYYRWVPEEMGAWGAYCEQTEGVHPKAEVRRWDRTTHVVTTYPLGTLRPYRFHVLDDGALLVLGDDAPMNNPTGTSKVPLVLRYVAPNGDGHQLTMTNGESVAGPLNVISDNSLHFTAVSAEPEGLATLYRVSFGPTGFGTPEVLMANMPHAHYVVNVEQGPNGAVYAQETHVAWKPLSPLAKKLFSSYTLPPWFESFDFVYPLGLLQVLPAPPTPIDTAASTVNFYRLIGEELYVVGKSEAGMFGLFRADLSAPANGLDLLGETNTEVKDLLPVGNHLFFASTDGIGRIDPQKAYQVSPVASSPKALPHIYPVWPEANAAIPPAPVESTGPNVGCLAEYAVEESKGPDHYLINVEDDDATLIDLSAHLDTVIWPMLGLQLVSAYSWTSHVATHPTGAVAFHTALPIPYADGTCEFFVLTDGLQHVECIDPTLTPFGLLPDDWGSTPWLRRAPIQFDVEGNIYYRWIPADGSCGADLPGVNVHGTLHPQAEIRRWDRTTHAVTTYPLGSFRPFRFHTLENGSLLASGFDLADPDAGAWPVLRYVQPDGAWVELVVPEFGRWDLPFHVVDQQHVVFPSSAGQGLFISTFDAQGFGTPHPLMTAKDGLKDGLFDNQGHLHWGRAINIQPGPQGHNYTLDIGVPTVPPPLWLANAPWWMSDQPWPRALVELKDTSAQLIDLPLKTLSFFRIVGTEVYLAGTDATGKHGLFRRPLSGSQVTIDLLGDYDMAIEDFYVRRDQQLFFSGYLSGQQSGNGFQMGQIDMTNDNALTILGTASAYLHPYWPGGS
ncbi:MAG: hypothetical protein HYV02_07085 [Deltaproteobacteria bacterium]|nr:hypothetical protein [Deltaproteobacteria bacterium]